MGKVMGTIVGTVVVAALLVAPAAYAKDGDVRVPGTCSGASTSKLKLSREDRGVELEFEVDQNRNGVRWNVVVLRNGSRIAKRVAVTRAPSGSFETRLVIASPGGARFVARATSPSGEVCTARASF